jgi:hypothetical protein
MAKRKASRKKRNTKCVALSDEEKIFRAFMRTLLEMQDDPDPETRRILARDREMSERCSTGCD